ncbi:MAG TPA: metallophosphoesterase [Thermoanaerobaculia bacterium]|nr:metallophosphoesterase [Thermoanaerobaculia bacterium]
MPSSARDRFRTATLASHTRVVAMAAVWLALFAYAGRPLLAGAAAAGLAPAFGWSALLVLAALPLLSLYRRSNWGGYAVLGVFSTLFFLVVIGDVVRGVYALMRTLAFADSWPMLDARGLSLTILGTAGVLSLVGWAQARCPRTVHVKVPVGNLPEELEGYRIVQWSDVHVGPTIQRRFVQKLVGRTNALGADAIAITGDFVDGPLEDLREQVEPLRDLRARDGLFYVTGNHEYYWRADDWCPALQELGLEFLKNSHRVVPRGNARIAFAGVTDPVGRNSHKQDVPASLRGAEADVKVLLSHRPQMADEASRLGVDLQLSGHTHGGQFFPFNLIIKKFQPIVAGLHRIGRTWLYVNRGTGYWGPPTRLWVGGEITVITLTHVTQITQP